MAPRSFRRILIVDPHAEYGDLAVQVGDAAELEEYLRNAAGRWRVAYHNDRLEEDFPALCAAVYRLGRCLLLVDEVDMFCEPTWIPDEFARLVKYGRHPKVATLCISRAPAEVHRTITRQAWEIYCFAIAEPRDLDYLRKYGRLGPAFADGLAELPPFAYRRKDLLDPAAPIEELTLGQEEKPPPAAKEGARAG